MHRFENRVQLTVLVTVIFVTLANRTIEINEALCVHFRYNYCGFVAMPIDKRR